MVMDHALDTQIFNADSPEMVDDLPGFLMAEIVASEPDAFMNAGDDLSALCPLGSAPVSSAQLSLRSGQGLFFLPEEAGVVDDAPMGTSGKRAKPHVDADSSIARRQGMAFHLTGEGDIPLACRRTVDGCGLGPTAQIPVHDHPDVADLGDRKHAVFDAAAGRRLREGEGIVPALALETGVAGLFTSLHPAKEGFEGPVHPDGHVLQDL